MLWLISVGDDASSVFVQWHNSAVEDEMKPDELVSTHTFQRNVPHHARVLDGTEDGTLVAFNDDEEPND